MKKRKTKKSVIKRFRVTKNGIVLHRSHNIRHLRSSKSHGQVRRLKQVKHLFNSIAIKVKKVLGK